jgi:hypothetical protein
VIIDPLRSSQRAPVSLDDSQGMMTIEHRGIFGYKLIGTSIGEIE